MKLPEWTKSALYGAFVGAILASIIGFSWGGWTTSRSANEMAEKFATKQVALAMVPVCLSMSESDPDRISKLTKVREATGFTRRNLFMETGWATLPGASTASRELADACIAGLKLDGS